MTDAGVTPDDVERASRRIDGLVRRTPVISHGDLILKRPDRWTIRTIDERLDYVGDPLAPLIGKQQELPDLS